MFYKGGNFCVFLFAFLYTKSLLKKNLLKKDLLKKQIHSKKDLI